MSGDNMKKLFSIITMITLLVFAYNASIHANNFTIDNITKDGREITKISLINLHYLATRAVTNADINEYIEEIIIRRGEINSPEIWLKLDNVNLNDNLFNALLTGLQALDLSIVGLELEFHIDDPVVLAIADFLTKSRLKYLELKYGSFTEVGVVALAGALMNNNSLKALSIDLRNFEDLGISALIYALQTNRTLNTLALTGDVSLQALLEIYATRAARNITLLKININKYALHIPQEILDKIAKLDHVFYKRNMLIATIRPYFRRARTNTFLQLTLLNRRIAMKQARNTPVPLINQLNEHLIREIAQQHQNDLDDFDTYYRMVMILLHGTGEQRVSIIHNLDNTAQLMARTIIQYQEEINTNLRELGALNRFFRLEPDNNGTLQLIEVNPNQPAAAINYFEFLSGYCGMT